MSTVVTSAPPVAAGHYEPTLSHQFLPGCRACGHKHPKAYMPPLDTDLCPGCGKLVEPPAEIVEASAVLTWKAAFGNSLMRVGALLLRLSRRL